MHKRDPGQEAAQTGAALALFLLPILVTDVAHGSEKIDTPIDCSTTCVEINDYQSDHSALHFTRNRSSGSEGNFGTGSRWRHGFESRLTRDGDDRILFDHHGQAHRFVQQSDGSYLAADNNSGTLSLDGDNPVWTNPAGVETEFQGSWPVGQRYPDGQTLRLDYQRGRLHTISDMQGERIVLDHRNDAPSTVTLPDGRTLLLSTDPCRSSPSTEPPEELQQCDTQANPVPGFDQVSTPPGVSTVDARPASCQSYFVDFYGTVRGEEIEAGLADLPPYNTMLPTNRSYPIVDFINGEELIVVRSRDLASPGFNNPGDPDALYDRLLRDGGQIQTRFLDPLARDGAVTRTENGRTTHITQTPGQHVTLQLLVRQNMASHEHWRQVDQARADLLQQYGIRLEVVIIP